MKRIFFFICKKSFYFFFFIFILSFFLFFNKDNADTKTQSEQLLLHCQETMLQSRTHGQFAKGKGICFICSFVHVTNKYRCDKPISGKVFNEDGATFCQKVKQGIIDQKKKKKKRTNYKHQIH